MAVIKTQFTMRLDIKTQAKLPEDRSVGKPLYDEYD